MNIYVLLINLLILCLAIMATAANPTNRNSYFDANGHFAVEVDIPAGSRQAVLEISDNLGSSAVWRPMIASPLDGRAARALFRLPPQNSPKVFARVKTHSSPTLPPVELTGNDLCFVRYEDLDGTARTTFFASASDKIREWNALPVAQWQSNLIAWALQDPAVATAEVPTGANDVTVRFKDGMTLVLMRPPRRYTGPATLEAPLAIKMSRAMSLSKAASVAPKAVNQVGENLPGSNAAITAFSLESTFPNSAPTIAGWLRTHKYQVTEFPRTTVDDIKNWSAAKPIGVLFWQSHGIHYKKKDGTRGVALVTRQFATPEMINGKYKAMVDAGELDFAIDDNPWKLPYFAITSEFVRKHIKFAPNSIVVVDACLAGDAELAKGFNDAHCGSFASWDWLSGPYSGTPCLKVFDRLLGMNEEPPVSSPPERSFSLKAIRWWMSAFGFDIDPSPMYEDQTRPNAKLTWFHHPTAPGHILRPSVMRALHENAFPGEPYAKYLIEGDFGDDPGESLREVLWGGLKMDVVRWAPNTGIVIRMPASPPAGNIEVIVKKDFLTRSNLLPITQWTVPFTYDIKTEGSLTAKMEMTVKFRADIHGSRGNPEMPLQYLPTLFFNMSDCWGTVSGTGTHNPSANKTITWSGGSNLTSIDHNQEDTRELKRIRATGTIQTKTGLINPFNLTADGDFTETEVTVHPDGSSTTEIRKQGVGFAGFGYPQPELPINPGNSVFRGNTITWPAGTNSIKLSWPSVTPQAAPDIETPR
ncbi:MAG: hypothetical protein EOP88_05720 [Verrucomicrobiaceae bacterium]|nr:MAG: hypothetical protein EOP88_05720 [Verrucomicrobiaceae bacterium]